MRISDWSSDVCSSDLAEVAPEREFEPAGDRVALDRGDHRLFEQHPRRAHRPGAAGVVAAGADRAEIETRAEMARTSGQDGDPRVPVFRESRERSEEHTSELQSLMRNSSAVFCLQKKRNTNTT